MKETEKKMLAQAEKLGFKKGALVKDKEGIYEILGKLNYSGHTDDVCAFCENIKTKKKIPNGILIQSGTPLVKLYKMKVLKIAIANDIKQLVKGGGSDVAMYIPMDKVTAIFHSTDDLPVVLVGDKQYKGVLEIIESDIETIIDEESIPFQESALTVAEFEVSKESDESQDVIPLLKAND